jgi:hypothetical protein
MMGKACSNSLLLIAIFVHAIAVAQADEKPSTLRIRLTSCAQALLVNPLTANFSGKTIAMFFPGNDEPVSILLGEKLGSGLGASAYTVNSNYFDQYEKSTSGVVAKLAHSPVWRTEPKAFAKFNAIIEAEYQQFQDLHDALPSLRKEPGFPQDFGWIKDPGYFPFADILEKGSFADGNAVLFKQRIRGSSLKEISAKYGENLSPELINGLKKIYELSQVLFRKMKIDGEPFKLDIYPSNFIWVEKPVDLKAMGLSHPSFLMVEASNHPQPVFQENYSFDRFLNDYKTYLRVNSRVLK